VVHWADVVATIAGCTFLSVRVSPPWSLDTHGEYVFSVQVSAEDAKPAVIKVRGRWDGTWQSLCGQLIK
jgi:hypothetical protein